VAVALLLVVELVPDMLLSTSYGGTSVAQAALGQADIAVQKSKDKDDDKKDDKSNDNKDDKDGEKADKDDGEKKEKKSKSKSKSKKKKKKKNKNKKDERTDRKGDVKTTSDIEKKLKIEFVKIGDGRVGQDNFQVIAEVNRQNLPCDLKVVFANDQVVNKSTTSDRDQECAFTLDIPDQRSVRGTAIIKAVVRDGDAKKSVTSEFDVN
jgi:hypothetical protein